MQVFDWDTAVIVQDSRRDEPRFIATGFIGNRLHVAAYTRRGDKRRIISLRKANQREAKNHVKNQT